MGKSLNHHCLCQVYLNAKCLVLVLERQKVIHHGRAIEWFCPPPREEVRAVLVLADDTGGAVNRRQPVGGELVRTGEDMRTGGQGRIGRDTATVCWSTFDTHLSRT